MLESMVSDDELDPHMPRDAQHPMPSTSHLAVADPKPSQVYTSRRGKYDRSNGKGIRSGWDAAARKHMR
eukprot:1490396-Pleurochrysis_carterae.AAC.1